MSNLFKVKDIFGGMLLIAGTSIGAGMLGIPMITSQTGLVPAVAVTVMVWGYMVLTGLLLLEVMAWMHEGANVISMSKRFLGKYGKIISVGTFGFLYYSLMVAYFAAGGPILISSLGLSWTGWPSFLIFALILGSVVGFGIKFIDKLNYILMIGLFGSYFALIGTGSSEIESVRFHFQNWQGMWLIAPVLFTAFGFHAIIPSLYNHYKGNEKVLRYAIIFGTLIPLFIYIIWQVIIIGVLPKELIIAGMKKGEAVSEIMHGFIGKTAIKSITKLFSFFAIITSMLGIAFSMVDFLGDGFAMKRTGRDRILLCLMTFIPPFIVCSINPSIFITAIGIAGGFGVAFLNGLLPAWLAWIGRYSKKLQSQHKVFGGKITLSILILAAVLVMIFEGILLIRR